MLVAGVGYRINTYNNIRYISPDLCMPFYCPISYKPHHWWAKDCSFILETPFPLASMVTYFLLSFYLHSRMLVLAFLSRMATSWIASKTCLATPLFCTAEIISSSFTASETIFIPTKTLIFIFSSGSSHEYQTYICHCPLESQRF